jgi:hypothetical protein
MPAYRGKSYDYQAYAAGNKVYGFGRSSPHVGGGLDPTGYRERDAVNRVKRNAMLRRLKAGQKKNYMSPDWLGGRGA